MSPSDFLGEFKSTYRGGSVGLRVRRTQLEHKLELPEPGSGGGTTGAAASGRGEGGLRGGDSGGLCPHPASRCS